MKQPIGIRWSKRPGQPGFNKEATKIMRRMGLFMGDRLLTDCSTSDPFAHTQTAAWLAGPETPIDRLLVIHRTGSGKTFAMIEILNKYFSDPRPKVVVFPNQALVNNFYQKMFSTPNAYKAWADNRAKRLHKTNTMDFFKSSLAMEGELHKYGKGDPAELSSPMRPFRYSIAGGRTVFSRDGRPEKPIFKIMFDEKTRNPFSNKIVLMDEVHNLATPPPDADASLRKRLARLYEALYTAENSIIVGLTATPFVNNEEDGRRLLKMIKGRMNQGARSNEGFISYFNTLPKTIYPKIMPGASAVKTIKVRMEGDNLAKYQRKMKERGKLSSKPNMRERQLTNLMNYCNTAFYYQHARSHARALRNNAKSVATKLEFIVSRVMENQSKSAILIPYKLGFNALIEVIKGMDPSNRHKFGFLGRLPGTKKMRQSNVLEEFNAKDNLRGDKIRTLVLDAEMFGEGIDLLGVRNFYICSPAQSYSQYKQWVGRVLRACAYAKLRPHERNVDIQMFIAVTDNYKEKTADEIVFEELEKETKEMEKAMHDVFGVVATDRIVLGLPS